MLINFARFDEVGERMRRAEDFVDREIAPGDPMNLPGQQAGYFGVGRRALHLVGSALIESPDTSFARILDFPSGYGRVTRWLRTAFPESDLTVCDLVPEAVAWCARKFEATGVRSDVDFSKVDPRGKFDVVWVGSLLTNLSEPDAVAFLDLATRLLNNKGLLVVTTHGRQAISNGRKRRDPRVFPKPADFERVAVRYEAGDYVFGEYPHLPGFGLSYMPLVWIERLIPRYPGVVLHSYRERGWNNHQDVVVLKKAGVVFEPAAASAPVRPATVTATATTA